MSIDGGGYVTYYRARKQKLTGKGTFIPTGLKPITAQQGFTLKH